MKSQEILEIGSNESIASLTDRALEKLREESEDKNENNDDHQCKITSSFSDHVSPSIKAWLDSQISSKYSENDPEMNPSSDENENHSKSDLNSNRSEGTFSQSNVSLFVTVSVYV